MKHRIPKALLTTAVLLGTACLAEAAVITVPQSNLISSTQYYTDIIGGGIGDIVVMTGGGNAPGVGVATGRNDDGFSGPIDFNFTTPLNFFGVPGRPSSPTTTAISASAPASPRSFRSVLPAQPLR